MPPVPAGRDHGRTGDMLGLVCLGLAYFFFFFLKKCEVNCQQF